LSIDPASLLDTSHFIVTWVDGEFWHGTWEGEVSECGESILERVKC
jgi:hypothetical protein